MIKSIILSVLLLFSPVIFADGYCSAFFVSPDGYAVTAAHCRGKQLTGIFYENNRKVTKTAKIIIYDATLDVMILKFDGSRVDYFITTGLIKVGEHLRVYGWPRPELLNYKLKVTEGKITGVEGNHVSFIGLIAAGNSGGAVVDDKNQAIGVVHAGYFTRFSTTSVYGIFISMNAFYILCHRINLYINTLPDNAQNGLKTIFLIVED